MTNAQPGWYPDPAGDPNKLRYWDGMQWTEHLAEPQPTAGGGAAPGTAGATAPTTQDAAPNATSQASGQGAPQAGEPSFVTPPRPTSTYTTSSFVGAAPYDAASPYGAPDTTGTADAPYPQTSDDHTLRLVAFIFAVLCTVSVCWAIIPLAWMIPMTVHCWGIYKGTKPNTTAFGVCTLIFLSLIGGILLLVSKKDR